MANESNSALATPEDYISRYGDGVKQERLNVILQDVSDLMISAYEGFWGAPYEFQSTLPVWGATGGC